MMQPRDEEEAAQEPLLNSSNSSNNNRNTENAVVGDERTVGVVEIREDEHLPGLSVEKYKSFAKFLLHFAKYILALVVFDVVAIIVVSEWCSYREETCKSRYDSWAGVYLSATLFLNVIFFFLAAKAIDRDVVKADRQEELSGEGGAENPQGCFGMDCNNRENIYGRVARKVDVWLISACTTSRTTMEPRPTGTSFLSHLCWILWALLLANSYADILEMGKHQFYDAKAASKNTTKPPTDHTLIPIPETIPPTVFSNISHFPKDLQRWIADGWTDPDRRYKFPTNPTFDRRNPKTPPPMLNDRMLLDDEDTLLEIVSKNNSLIKIYHRDIESPKHFIPVQNSMDKDDPARASQYCFLSKTYESHLARRRSSPPYKEAHCIQASAIETGKASTLKNATLNWGKMEYENDYTDEYENEVMAASYKDLVFFSRRRLYGQEVIQLIPGTMETSTIYSIEMHNYNRRYESYDDYRSRRRGDPPGFGLFNGICGFGLASYFLISKQGLVSGFFPLAITLSLILSVLQYMDDDIAVPEVRITLGTIFFLFLIYNDGNNTRIPAWVGKDALTWALYGWISSFLIYGAFVFLAEYDRRWRGAEELAVVFLILIGVVLGHPTVQATGYILIVGSLLSMIIDGYYDFEETLVPILSGVGCVVLGNWIAANKEMIYSRLKYTGWYISRWMYLKFGGSRPRHTSA